MNSLVATGFVQLGDDDDDTITVYGRMRCVTIHCLSLTIHCLSLPFLGLARRVSAAVRLGRAKRSSRGCRRQEGDQQGESKGAGQAGQTARAEGGQWEQSLHAVSRSKGSGGERILKSPGAQELRGAGLLYIAP